MAASRDLRSHVKDVVTCPICLELFDSPKSLPCLHTFCLKCIDGHMRHCRHNEVANCPVCRHTFSIPESGADWLVSNFFITGLVEARKTATDVAVQVPCEVCLHDCDGDDSTVAVSTMYCVDCNQKLCERCSRPHVRWKGGPHKVVPTGGKIEIELIQTQGGKCNKHKDEYVKLFCFDDMVNICVICFAEEHQQHKCKNVSAVADEFVKQIETDLVHVGKRADEAMNEISRLDTQRDEFLAGVEHIMGKIQKRGKQLKKLIDAHVKELMLEVQSLKTETCKEIENLKDDAEMKLLAFETFSAYCSELKLKGKPCDVTRSANDLHKRATELLRNEVTVQLYCAPTITFTPVQIQELIDAGQNLIGRVLVPRVVHTLPEAEDVYGVTSLDDELFVLRHKNKEQVEVYNLTATATAATTTTEPALYNLQRQLTVPGLEYGLYERSGIRLWDSLCDMTSCKHYRCLYITDCSNCCVYRVELNGKITKMFINNEPRSLSVTSQYTVLITCRRTSKLLELTTEGKQLREISIGLQLVKMVSLHHAIQLPNGQFVVCHGEGRYSTHRVCILDSRGCVTRSYGGPRGSAAVGQLSGPCHLATDNDGFIYVADYCNRRVLALSPTLRFVCEIVSSDQLKGEPGRQFLDVDRRRLHVIDGCRVVVFVQL